MADTPEMEVNEMDQVTEDAATGVAAIKRAQNQEKKLTPLVQNTPILVDLTVSQIQKEQKI